MTEPEPEYWYRFDNHFTAPPLDEWENPIGEGGVMIHLSQYKVVRHTPCGVQLDMGPEEVKFVLASATKRFACPTIEEARASFLVRKRKQLSIYMHRVADMRKVLEKADYLMDREVQRLETKR